MEKTYRQKKYDIVDQKSEKEKLWYLRHSEQGNQENQSQYTTL